MKLTAKARAAVTAMADLAGAPDGSASSLADIAVRQNLSLAFLEQIFGKLRRAGLVESRRGAAGGYVLAQRADTITAAAVINAVEEEIRSTACLPGSTKGCTGSSARCLTHGLWATLDSKIEEYLSGVTLDELKGQAMAGEVADA